MAIPMLSETERALGGGALPSCDSRSLFNDRFADPLAKDSGDTTPRKNWFDALIKKRAEKASRSPWIPANAIQIHARLMSRLMVDLAGGVMENANVQLDRFGLPIIPGSAVKGCARRMALQSLHDWIEAKTERPAVDDVCRPCCEGFSEHSDMLAAIARVFGWTPEDWKVDKTKSGYFKSDFAWATNGDQHLLQAARSLNPDFQTFSGSVAFLAAAPNNDPGLELDVVTPHHTRYYKGERGFETAPDIEDPVPVFFPAVKPQGENDYFTFPLIALRLSKKGDIAHANGWLACGLELLGIGAKTNAGYGWFDTSETFQESVKARLAAAAAAAREHQMREAERAAQLAAAEAARLKREEEAAATRGMTDDEKADYQLSKLGDAQFETKVRNFFKEPKKGGPSESEKNAIIRALRGPRIAYWQELKPKASKGGDLARAVAEIHALNKQLHGDKMP